MRDSPVSKAKSMFITNEPNGFLFHGEATGIGAVPTVIGTAREL